jgi:ATP-binding cassette subfamily D (ALD) long-chain fatty acid import protein
LFKYHRFLLRLTGNNGEWEWETIGTREQLQSVEKELSSLTAKLQQVDDLKKRLAAIDQELTLKI